MKRLQVRIPLCVRDQDHLLIPQEGDEYLAEEGVSFFGSLSVVFDAEDHTTFKRTGDYQQDLMIEEVISLQEAFGGYSLTLLHLDGIVKNLTIPSDIVIPHGSWFKCAGLGLPYINSHSLLTNGDLVVHFTVIFPDSLDPQDLSRLKDLLRSYPNHPSHEDASLVEQTAIMIPFLSDHITSQPEDEWYDESNEQSVGD